MGSSPDTDIDPQNVRRIREKIMCHTSARFDVIILITRTINDTRRSKTIKKILKFG